MLERGGLFGPVETARFSFEQTLDRDGLLDLVLSRSYLAKLPPPEREPVLDAVGALYDETAGPEACASPTSPTASAPRVEERCSRAAAAFTGSSRDRIA